MTVNNIHLPLTREDLDALVKKVNNQCKYCGRDNCSCEEDREAWLWDCIADSIWRRENR